MAVQNLGFTPLALRRNRDEEFQRILASGAAGGGPRIIPASGAGGGGGRGNGLGQGLSAIGDALSGFAEMRNRQKAAEDERARAETMSRAAQAFSGGVKEYRNPDNTDEVMVQGQAPGAGAALSILGADPLTAPDALKAHFAMAANQKAPPTSVEARMALMNAVDRDRKDTVGWDLAMNAPVGSSYFDDFFKMKYTSAPKENNDKIDLYDPKTGTKQNVRVGSRTEQYYRDKGWMDVNPTGGGESPYGSGFEGGMFTRANALAAKIERGEGLSSAEQREYQAIRSRLAAPRIYTLPDGRVVSAPGMDLSAYPGGGGARQPVVEAQDASSSQAASVVPGIPGAQVIGEKPKKFTESESTSAGYANRMTEAEARMASVTESGFDPANIKDNAAAGLPGGNFLVSDGFQLWRQAQEDWVRAKLRKESGAVIGEDEMAREITTYFPQPGDSAEVVAQKAASRKTALNSMVAQAGGAYEQFHGSQQEKAAPKIPTLTSIDEMQSMIRSGKMKPGDRFLSPSGAELIVMPDGSWARAPGSEKDVPAR